MLRRAFALIAGIALCSVSTADAQLPVVRNGKPTAQIFIDGRGAKGNGVTVLKDTGNWLADSLRMATGVKLKLTEKLADGAAIVIARADSWPKIAAEAGLKSESYDAYCIATRPQRVYILGNSESAARHGVADLLRRWGFRWFAPSPRWHFVPKLKDVAVDLNITDAPALVDRRIWYAYGMAGDDLRPLMNNYTRWAIANRLSVGSLMQTGHSYGNIVRRNQKIFDAHPEYYALLPDGKRDNERAINARKLCYTNRGLIDLVVQDRIRLLEQNRKVNPASFMVSIDPSDGQGTCHCDECQKLKTTSDRVFHLANETARGLKKKHPKAWVGLYAYSSHRLPPTIDIEPNVYVQVAMGFNRTKYTLPELVEKWSQKVGAVGLREYYGVEAWDWGLPGRMRGGRVDYHRKWIPFYAKRKLNAVNAETNANWGGQTLGLYVASQLMWNPNTDVNALVNEFFDRCFGNVAGTMRKIYADFDAAPPLRSATLLPLFHELDKAAKSANDEKVKIRITDLMAYLVYVAHYRDFDLVQRRRPSHDKEYYDALKPLMQYAWRIRHRDMVHYYALARRLCNGLPVQDKRLDFYMFNKKTKPVWMAGDSLTDAEIAATFSETMKRLEADDDPTVTFSRYLEPARAKGDDGGPSSIVAKKQIAVARFRRGLRGYLAAAEKATVHFGIAPTSREAAFTVYLRGDTVLFEKKYRRTEDDAAADYTFQKIAVELPRANEYRVEITGDFVLQVPPATPFVFEASVHRPAWIDYSGPHYFYVPRGTKELIVDANPRLSLHIPGRKQRLDVTPAQHQPGKEYVAVKVPPNTSGKIWHTSNMTRGKIALLNVPPLLSFHRHGLFVPRETAEADGLTTRE